MGSVWFIKFSETFVSIDRLPFTLRYGCPAMEEIEYFSTLYKKQLDEIVECGDIPLDLALEVCIGISFSWDN